MSTHPPAVRAAGSMPLRRLKYVAPLSSVRAEGNSRTDGYVGLEHVESWTGRLLSAPSAEGGDTEEAATGALAAFTRGDVLFGKLRPYLAKAFLAEQDGVASTELLVLKPTPEINSRYLLYLFLTPAFVGLVDSSTFGSKMPRSDWQFVGSIRVPVPRLEDQQRIANFLDAETARIDALIAEKERFLALLGEKRAAIVTQAVTHGLDPKVRVKLSGLEWSGEVPAHWRVMRLKYVVRGIDQGWSPQCDSRPAGESEWGVLKTGCVNGGRFREEENKFLPSEIEPATEIEIHQGDVLMSRASGSLHLIGSVALVERQPIPQLLLSDKIYRLNVRSELMLPGYLAVVMGTPAVRHQIRLVVSGAEGLANNVAKSDILEFRLLLPPLDEQRSILSHIDDSVRHFAQVEKATADSIALLRERRSAVVTAAVTGAIPLEGMT